MVEKAGYVWRSTKPLKGEQMVKFIDVDKTETERGDHSVPRIILKVIGQDGNEVVVRIQRCSQMRTLMNAYCDHQSVNFNSTAFLFNGRRLRGDRTPNELGMKDSDVIDAY